MMREPILMLGDCLERMSEISEDSVDMVLCDLPYGTTACKWDSVIPFEPLWRHYRRVTKPNAAIVLTGCQPFTSVLITSNLRDFRYCWVWDKVNKVTGALTAKKMPMRDYEDVAVFYRQSCTYNPQMRPGGYVTRHVGKRSTPTLGAVADKPDMGRVVDSLYPKRIIGIPAQQTTRADHPTQKPVALLEYFIKTYTHEGETVLDNTMGSGSTGVACINTGRNFIGIERDPNYFAIAERRIHDAPNAGPLFTQAAE
jgi:hypothetical protein